MSDTDSHNITPNGIHKVEGYDSVTDQTPLVGRMVHGVLHLLPTRSERPNFVNSPSLAHLPILHPASWQRTRRGFDVVVLPPFVAARAKCF